MRVILDTNILVSALLTQSSPPRQALIAWRSGKFRLLTCEQQFEEMRRVTRRPGIRSRLKPANAGRLVNEMRKYAEIRADLPFVELSPDPRDDFLLALAQAGKADFLVTGDKSDLLALARHHAAAIVTARRFIEFV